MDAKPKDVGAAKGAASPGGENDEEKLNKASGQMGHAGQGKQKAEFQPDASAGTDNELGMRGMSSSHSAKFWKESGYHVPTAQGQDHHPGKK